MNQTYLPKEAVAKKPRFEVYVAGLPPAIDHSGLKAYFRNFGRVNKIFIYTQNAQSPNSAAAKVKLHCKVTVHDEPTYRRILSERNHCFMGRNLFCQEFKKGRELSDHNAHVKTRRVIVKKVPSYYSEHKLLELIQARVGAVDTIYEFKTDAQNLPTVGKRFKSFSVSFRQPEALDTIPGSLAISLPDSHHRIIIERFEQRLFKDFSGGLEKTTSDQTDISKQILKYQEHNSNEGRSLNSQVMADLGLPEETLQRTLSNFKQSKSKSNNQILLTEAAQATFIIEDGNQISSYRPEEIADHLTSNRSIKHQPLGAKKSPAWLTRTSDHQVRNLRFNIREAASIHPVSRHLVRI
jgi:hypothetical protein